MTPRLLLATRNRGKFQEIMEVLAPLQARGFEFVSLNDLGIHEDAPEEALTYEANAVAKAMFYAERSGLPTLADDSGIQVNALPQELGVRTRRWGAGAEASDEAWMEFFLNRMRTETDRSARFVCAAAFYEPLSQDSHVFLGQTEGILAEELKAPMIPGIPLSSIFYPEGLSQVYSQLSLDEKNKLSHRGKAFAALFKFLAHRYPL